MNVEQIGSAGKVSIVAALHILAQLFALLVGIVTLYIPKNAIRYHFDELLHAWHVVIGEKCYCNIRIWAQVSMRKLGAYHQRIGQHEAGQVLAFACSLLHPMHSGNAESRWIHIEHPRGGHGKDDLCHTPWQSQSLYNGGTAVRADDVWREGGKGDRRARCTRIEQLRERLSVRQVCTTLPMWRENRRRLV